MNQTDYRSKVLYDHYNAVTKPSNLDLGALVVASRCRSLENYEEGLNFYQPGRRSRMVGFL